MSASTMRELEMALIDVGGITAHGCACLPCTNARALLTRLAAHRAAARAARPAVERWWWSTRNYMPPGALLPAIEHTLHGASGDALDATLDARLTAILSLYDRVHAASPQPAPANEPPEAEVLAWALGIMAVQAAEKEPSC